MTDVLIYTEGRAGRITLNRPEALNALSWEMCRRIDAALAAWAEDDAVALVIIDATGERAFCAGGDVQDIHASGQRGDLDHARRFWADEYRMNARIARFPKPVVALLQGFTFGGGVGLGCHAGHRVVCETSQIALPETALGLVPDVGGSRLLARAPGRLGEYLAATAARMGPGDAIRAGFADVFVPREFWLDLVLRLEASGRLDILDAMAEPAPPARLAAHQDAIDAAFAGSPAEIMAALAAQDDAFAAETLARIRRNAPLAVAAALANIRAQRTDDSIEAALAREYRFTARAVEQGDFLEGIRAAIIDKDRAPRWRHARLEDVTEAEVAQMLAGLGPDELVLGA